MYAAVFMWGRQLLDIARIVMPMARKNVSRMKKFAPLCPEILAVSNLILPVGVTAPANHLTSRYAHRIPMMANVWNPGDNVERNLLWNSPSLEMQRLQMNIDANATEFRSLLSRMFPSIDTISLHLKSVFHMYGSTEMKRLMLINSRTMQRAMSAQFSGDVPQRSVVGMLCSVVVCMNNCP